jgi:hypothetical protein
MLKKRVWKFPQSVGKPRTESQTVGTETNRKMTSIVEDNVNIQEQSCREKRTREKENALHFIVEHSAKDDAEMSLWMPDVANRIRHSRSTRRHDRIDGPDGLCLGHFCIYYFFPQ